MSGRKARQHARKAAAHAQRDANVAAGKKVVAISMAGFVGHHSLEMLMFHGFEWMGHHLGLTMAVLAFGGLAITAYFNRGG